MTKKTRRSVSPEQRKRITLALMEPGCDVDELAKKYNLVWIHSPLGRVAKVGQNPAWD